MTNLLLAMLFFAVSGFGVIRALDSENSASVAPETYEPTQNQAVQGSGRTFVLLIESLRARTALSSDLMPYLANLASTSYTTVLRPVDEARSAGSLAAAFTGRDELQGLGTLRMFVEPPRPRPSLFTQLRTNGLSSVVYSDQWSFAPFHQDITQRLPRRGSLGSEVEAQLSELNKARGRFLGGHDNLVIYHSTILDIAAHRFTVAHLEYARITRLIDDAIRDLDAAISPHDHLVIMGDHGHTDAGRHGPGLDVPTVLIGRGPAFIPGRPKGVLPIRAVRSLLSHVLNLPLPVAYEGPRPLARENFPVSGSSHRTFEGRDFVLVEGLGFFQNLSVAMGVGVLFSLFWFLGRGPKVGANDFPLDDRPHWFSWGLPGALAVLGFGLGLWMAKDSGFRQILPDYVLNQIWGGLLAFGMLGILFAKWTAAGFSLWVFGVFFLSLYPGVLSIGSPGVFGPSWIMFAVLAAFQTLRHVPKTNRVLRYRRQMILWASLVALLLQPFFHVESRDAISGQFWPLIHEIVPISLYPRSIVSGMIMWILVHRERQGVLNNVLAVIMVLYIIMIQVRIIPENHWGNLALALSLMGLAYASWRGPRLGRVELDARGFGRTAFLCALLVLTFYLIRVGHVLRTDLLMVFAATRYSILLGGRAARSVRDLQITGILILFLGIVGVGWMTLGWSLGRVEWGFLFDFVSPDLVSRRMGHFYPLILIRYVIPVMVIRLLVTEVLVGKTLVPMRWMAFLVGLKYVMSLGILLGIAVTTSASAVYVGALSHIAVFLLLIIGLV
jgi:hypothetical protein